MEDRIIARIEVLSAKIGDLIDSRQSKIKELRAIDSEIENLTAILFELKSLLDVEEHQP